MAKIGLDRVAGWFPAEALAAWSDAGGAVERVAQTSSSAISAAATTSGVERRSRSCTTERLRRGGVA
jgi:hypothetical protein